MNYFASASTDVGIVKETNQDSVCVKIAEFEKHGQVDSVIGLKRNCRKDLKIFLGKALLTNGLVS